MKRLLTVVLTLFSLAHPALAQSVSDKVFANLKAQGYVVVKQDRTWLGRIWVLARSNTVQREVVFDPTTGEILRDYAVSLASIEAREQYELAQQTASNTAAADNGSVDKTEPSGATPVAVGDVSTGEALAEPPVETVPTVSLTSPNAMVGTETSVPIGPTTEAP